MRRLVILFTAVAAVSPAAAGLFSVPQPELIYSGEGPGLAPGVLVIRDKEAFEQAIEPLDPAFGGPAPKTKKRTVLRIVGGPRDDRCRDTALIEVSTQNLYATVKLEERVGEPGCACAPDPRPPRVFLVAVTRWVRKAKLETTEVVAPCEATMKEDAEELVARPTLIYESSWNEAPGVKVIAEAAEYRQVLTRLGVTDRGPAVDFEKNRVIAVTGRPRENGCRRTRILDARLASREEAVFEIEEVYPGTGQQCIQVFMQPVVYLYRVPASVMSARSITREVR